MVGWIGEEGDRTSAHELPELYVRNCSVYVSRISTIERGSVLGNDSRGFLMPRERSIDINDEVDWKMAALLFAEGEAAGGTGAA
ncbi:MAG: hypothetical protein IPJ65_39815 [Archangiaceae bacterium]|nr:hypothetical protein [Archangiaceae bacterium]